MSLEEDIKNQPTEIKNHTVVTINDKIIDDDQIISKINNIKSKSTEKDDEFSGINKWGQEYTETVLTWKKECDEMAFVYDEALHDRKRLLARFVIILLIINSISTVISPLQFTEESNPELNLAFKIFTSLMTLLTTVLLGVMKYYSWDATIEKYQEFVTKVDNFLSNITAEVSLPKRLRKDAEEFIRQNKDSFNDLIKNAPDIDPKEYRTIEHERYCDDYKKEVNLRAIKLKKIANTPVNSLHTQLDA